MVNIFGIASGFDSGAMIDAILQAKSIPISQLQSDKGGVETKISKLATVKSAMAELATALEGFQEMSDVLALTAESGDETIFTATSTGDSVPGTYTVDVQTLAVAEKNRSDAFANTDTVKEGTLTIAVDGGDPVDITIEDGDTIQDVAAKITSSGAGVDATVIFDGADYHLQVSAKDTGYTTAAASDAIVLTESYTGGAGKELALSELTTAVNAQIELDGLTISSTSNTVTGMLEGVTLELEALGSTTLTVAKDKEAIKENIQAFVDAYNNAHGTIADELKVSETSDRSQSLAGDTLLQSMKSALSTAIGTQVGGLAGAFESLAEIGITTDAAGKLVIDDADLDAAMDSDMNAVGDLFSADDIGLADTLLAAMEPYTQDGDGLLDLREDSFNDQIGRIDDRIETLELRLERLHDLLVKQFTAMEQVMNQLQAQGSALNGLLLPAG